MKVVVYEIFEHTYEVDAEDAETAAKLVLSQDDDVEDKGTVFSESHMIRVYDSRGKLLLEDVVVDEDIPEESSGS